MNRYTASCYLQGTEHQQDHFYFKNLQNQQPLSLESQSSFPCRCHSPEDRTSGMCMNGLSIPPARMRKKGFGAWVGCHSAWW